MYRKAEGLKPVRDSNRLDSGRRQKKPIVTSAEAARLDGLEPLA